MARRLAARLLPRFAPRFPEKLDKVGRALMDLSAWDGSGLSPAHLHISEAARWAFLAFCMHWRATSRSIVRCVGSAT